MLVLQVAGKNTRIGLNEAVKRVCIIYNRERVYKSILKEQRNMKKMIMKGEYITINGKQ